MSLNPKKASDHLPYCQDQGMPYLAGAGKAGVSIQVKALIAMPADGILTFAAMGMMDMADTAYAVFIHNHTDAADEATLAANVRLTDKITVTGPDTADLLDVMIVGRVAGQTAAA